ncbi:MAG: 3-hydroxyacyl-CoA dehydrogenase family protein [Thermoplasmatota archaeon]
MQVQTVAVLGAGTMGQGIAQTCAQSNLETRLFDALPGAAEKARDRIEAFWSRAVEKGKATPQDQGAWRGRLTLCSTLADAVAGADLVIEAVPEVVSVKCDVLGQADVEAPAKAVLATNTSSLSVTRLAEATRRPSQFIGMHFFNPVPLMPLVEIVCHPGTSPSTLEATQAVAKRLGKSTIVVRDSPGFATSRLGIVLGNEAMRMLAEGVASTKDIDAAMRLGYGHPMGPLELSDVVGLDVRLAISDYLYDTLGGDQFQSPELLRGMVKLGHVGKKAGLGFYDWSSGTPKERVLP